MQALQASLTDQQDSTVPNPNLDAAKNPDALQVYEECVDAASSSKSLHTVTPLIHSEPLSKRTGHNIYLKLDALQPSGSFKIRGIGRVCQLAVEKYGSSAHLVSSSGGNAGLAAATAAKAMSVKCTVYVPGSTPQSVKDTLQGLRANVITVGSAWDDCDQAARKAVQDEECAVYVHPFEGEDVWEGHSTIVKEIYEQLQQQNSNASPDMIVCAVGGGGLLNGILRGVSRLQDKRTGAEVPKIVGVQDFGADSFCESMKAYHRDPVVNADTVVTLPAITSLATSMGAKTCSATTLRYAKSFALSGTIASPPSAQQRTPISDRYFSAVAVDDSVSGSATWQFCRDHDLLFELACGAALSPAYQSERLLTKLIESLPRPEEKKNIILIACGGSKINPQMIQQYETDYGLQDGVGRMEVDGVEV